MHDERLAGVSIVTLSYRRPDLFCRMADALPVEDERIVERILVNNGGDSITAAEARARDWTVLDPGTNLSFSAGCNLGVAESVSTHVVLLNNDALLDADAIRTLWAHRTQPIVAPVIVQSDERVNFAGGVLAGPDLIPVHADRGRSPLELPAEGVRWCPWVTFACVQIARDLWDDLGGLAEGYRYSFEDVDFCLRALERGVLSMTALEARVTHDEMGTRTGETDEHNWRLFRERWYDTGRLRRALGLA